MQEIGRRFKENVERREQAELARLVSEEGRTALENEIKTLQAEIAATARGVMDPKLLYETPFTDFDRNGVEGVFAKTDAARIVKILRDFEPRSAA